MCFNAMQCNHILLNATFRKILRHRTDTLRAQLWNNWISNFFTFETFLDLIFMNSTTHWTNPWRYLMYQCAPRNLLKFLKVYVVSAYSIYVHHAHIKWSMRTDYANKIWDFNYLQIKLVYMKFNYMYLLWNHVSIRAFWQNNEKVSAYLRNQYWVCVVCSLFRNKRHLFIVKGYDFVLLGCFYVNTVSLYWINNIEITYIAQ